MSLQRRPGSTGSATQSNGSASRSTRSPAPDPQMKVRGCITRSIKEHKDVPAAQGLTNVVATEARQYRICNAKQRFGLEVDQIAGSRPTNEGDKCQGIQDLRVLKSFRCRSELYPADGLTRGEHAAATFTRMSDPGSLCLAGAHDCALRGAKHLQGCIERLVVACVSRQNHEINIRVDSAMYDARMDRRDSIGVSVPPIAFWTRNHVYLRDHAHGDDLHQSLYYGPFTPSELIMNVLERTTCSCWCRSFLRSTVLDVLVLVWNPDAVPCGSSTPVLRPV
nr:hypothetical protein CFP56_21037 [Quercus suber]